MHKEKKLIFFILFFQWPDHTFYQLPPVLTRNSLERVEEEKEEEFQDPFLETERWEVYWDREYGKWFYHDKIKGEDKIKNQESFFK